VLQQVDPDESVAIQNPVGLRPGPEQLLNPLTSTKADDVESEPEIQLHIESDLEYENYSVVFHN